MRKIMVLFKREYLAAVKTKSFIVSMVLVPIMMAGGFLTVIIMENNKDTTDKKIAVVDYSNEMKDLLIEKVNERNENEIISKSGEKIGYALILDFIEPNQEDSFSQRLELSNQVRAKDIHAFVEIGKDIMNIGKDGAEDYIRYYSEHGVMDDARHWFSNVINPFVRQKKIEALNLGPEATKSLFVWRNVEGMGLVNIDKKTGETEDAKKSSELESFLIPYIILILMFMLTMMSAIPLLSAVMEEKTEKIAEVLLGKVTPFQFMMGKVLGGIGVGLTVAGVYIFGAVFTVSKMDFADMIPMDILPWFFIYLVFYIVMVGSGMAALGATCNDNKDAQTIQFPAMLPVLLPMFIIFPLIQNPTGAFATTLAFIPPFTPPIMMIRMATPVTIPVWQPILGLGLVVLFTLFSVWIGARIFRTAILIQGQKPSLGNLVKYAFKK